MTGKKYKDISPQEALLSAQDDKLLLIDVREEFERLEGSIPGSTHIPLGSLSTALKELESESRELAFVCAHGVRSIYAAAAIADRLGRQTYNVVGGAEAWLAVGLPFDGRLVE